MKLKILLLLVLISFVQADVGMSITADKTEITLGESVHFDFSMTADKKVSGSVAIINLDTKHQIRELTKSSKCNCGSDSRLIGNVDRSYTHTPNMSGTYQIRAYFTEDGGKRMTTSLNYTVREKNQMTKTTVKTTTTTKKTTITTPTTTKTTTKQPTKTIKTTITAITTITTITTPTTNTTEMNQQTPTTTINPATTTPQPNQSTTATTKPKKSTTTSIKTPTSTTSTILQPIVKQIPGSYCSSDSRCDSGVCLFNKCRGNNLFNKFFNWLGESI